MLHESKVLKIIPQDLQPSTDIKCRGCVNGLWRFNRIKGKVDVYCKQFYTVTYSNSEEEETPNFNECDGFSDEIEELRE